MFHARCPGLSLSRDAFIIIIIIIKKMTKEKRNLKQRKLQYSGTISALTQQNIKEWLGAIRKEGEAVKERNIQLTSDNSNLQGKSKKVRVIGSSKKNTRE